MNMNDGQRKLAEDNMKLVHFIINKHYPFCNGNDDVIQVGMMALCRAAMAWDESKGKFSTIASVYIVNAIKKHFSETRQKAEVLSLDYEYEGASTLSDVIEGDHDVESLSDVIDFLESEKKINREVLSMFAQGYESKEIASHLGVTRSYVNTIKRIAKLKWEDMNNDK